MKVGDKVEALVQFMNDLYDADSACPEDHPEWVDVHEGRRGTIAEVASSGELRIRWSHRKWVNGWYDPEYVKVL